MSHICNNLKTFLKKLEKNGFKIVLTKKCVKIIPPNKNIKMYISHFGSGGYHPVRRYVKNMCKMDIK